MIDAHFAGIAFITKSPCLTVIDRGTTGQKGHVSLHFFSGKQWRRSLQKLGGQKAAIFRQRRLWVLKSSILLLNFPKMINFQPQIWYCWKTIFRRKESFPTGSNLANGAIADCPKLPKTGQSVLGSFRHACLRCFSITQSCDRVMSFYIA